jgi:hypothetical protein
MGRLAQRRSMSILTTRSAFQTPYTVRKIDSCVVNGSWSTSGSSRSDVVRFPQRTPRKSVRARKTTAPRTPSAQPEDSQWPGDVPRVSPNGPPCNCYGLYRWMPWARAALVGDGRRPSQLFTSSSTGRGICCTWRVFSGDDPQRCGVTLEPSGHCTQLCLC